MRALIIGGSLGGLATSLTLRAIGWETIVFEQAPARLSGRGAGLIAQWEVIRYLEAHGIATRELVSLPVRVLRRLAADGGVLVEEPSTYRLTSWDAIYGQLLDALPAGGCVFGDRLVSFSQSGGRVTGRFSSGRCEEADLLVGADGMHSTVRRQLLPGVTPRFAGWVTWRGTVADEDLPPGLASEFRERYTVFSEGTREMVGYFVPGSRAGRETLHWAWRVPEQEAVPAEMPDPDMLPPQFRAAVSRTRHPFSQPLFRLAVDRMVVGHACLLGDAAFLAAPHSAGGTWKAFANAMHLAEAIRLHSGELELALQSWERSEILLGKDMAMALADAGAHQ